MRPDCTLGLAAGSPPIGTYDQLVECKRYERVIHSPGDVDSGMELRDVK